MTMTTDTMRLSASDKGTPENVIRSLLVEAARMIEEREDTIRGLYDSVDGAHPEDFIQGAIREAKWQQVHRNDQNKTDAEWFWTAGYLLSKVVHRQETPERRQHHITATAALLANWHRHIADNPDNQTHSRDGIDDDK